MIPFEKEMKIYVLLKEGLDNAEIGRRVGVGTTTVERKRKQATFTACSPAPCQLRRLSKFRKCETCGIRTKTWPCLLCHPEVGYYNEPRPAVNPGKLEMNKVLANEAPALLGLARDIQELYELGIIPHILFRNLACRARSSLERISALSEKSNGQKEKSS